MVRRLVVSIVALMVFFTVPFLLSCAQARPPKPGPDYVWVAPHKAPNGAMIPGHWKYTGPAKPGKDWVPGHHAPNGKWVPGHWKTVAPMKKGGVWVPGHWGPKGKWIPGHWR